jgi:hypothetical protein
MRLNRIPVAQEQISEIKTLNLKPGKTISLFGGLPISVITSLVPHFTIIDVPKGSAAVKQGETCDKFYIVLSGSFSCFVVPQHGQHHHHHHHNHSSSSPSPSPSPHPVQHAQKNAATSKVPEPSKSNRFSQIAIQVISPILNPEPQKFKRGS